MQIWSGVYIYRYAVKGAAPEMKITPGQLEGLLKQEFTRLLHENVDGDNTAGRYIRRLFLPDAEGEGPTPEELRAAVEECGGSMRPAGRRGMGGTMWELNLPDRGCLRDIYDSLVAMGLDDVEALEPDEWIDAMFDPDDEDDLS